MEVLCLGCVDLHRRAQPDIANRGLADPDRIHREVKTSGAGRFPQLYVKRQERRLQCGRRLVEVGRPHHGEPAQGL